MAAEDRVHDIAIVKAAALGHVLGDPVHVQIAVNEGKKAAEGRKPVVRKVGYWDIGV
jgi:hypothetical protein